MIVPKDPADSVPTRVPLVEGVARTFKLAVVCTCAPIWNPVGAVLAVVALELVDALEIFPAASVACTV